MRSCHDDKGRDPAVLAGPQPVFNLMRAEVRLVTKD
jgi:hypothetical protein